MIYHNEEYMQIAELTQDNEIKFTQAFLDSTVKLGGNRRKFASNLISHWGNELSTLLDYFGPDDQEADLYTGLDTDQFDVREDLPELWEYHELAADGLDAEWYRDILRAKIVSIKIPKRLIENYVKVALKNMEK